MKKKMNSVAEEVRQLGRKAITIRADISKQSELLQPWTALRKRIGWF